MVGLIGDTLFTTPLGAPAVRTCPCKRQNQDSDRQEVRRVPCGVDRVRLDDNCLDDRFDQED